MYVFSQRVGGFFWLEFLRVRKIPLTPYTPQLSSSSSPLPPLPVLPRLATFSVLDRDLYDTSLRALVSWVRYYKEHQASSIFRLAQVKLGEVAGSLGVVRFPKMPEVRPGTKVDGFVGIEGVDVCCI